jgi:hypothetical protein
VEWGAVSAVASVISMIAIVVTTLHVRAELQALDQEHFLESTNGLFTVWQSKEFMDSQLWLLHRLDEKTWADFVRTHRADVGEAAFHRVGSFYDRVGTLIRLRLVRKEEILTTVGSYAVQVWQKIGLLVREARAVEHSTLFADFERMLPDCYECFVPALGGEEQARAPSPPGGAGRPDTQVPRVGRDAVQRRLRQGEPVTVLDVRVPGQVEADPRTLPGALWIPAADVERRYRELLPARDVVVYCG